MSSATPEVRRVAASLPRALRARDFTAAFTLLSEIGTEGDKANLIFLLARCADRGRLNAETGWIAATPAEFHARFEWLRQRGVDKADMDPRVTEGERRYQRESRAIRRRIKGQAA